MAKASESDLDMAMDVANVLDDIERGFFPTKLQSDEDAESEQIEWIDTNDHQQYERLIYGLKRLLNKGSIMRVIWGMAVVCDPSNELIDPDADTIEHHPKRQQLEKQRDQLLADLRGIAAIAHCGGLVQMSESDALTAIRRATLPHFSTDATEEQHRATIASMKDHFRDATKMINSESDMIERECCGTFFRTPHRSTCKKYRGKKGGA